MVRCLDDRIRSKSLKRLILDIQIEYMRQGKPAPSSEKIGIALIKKYGITKEDIIHDRIIKL